MDEEDERENSPSSVTRPTMKPAYSRFKYSEEALLTDVTEIREKKVTLNQASIKYSIPKGTLHNKVKEIVPLQRKMGPDSILSPAEEERVESWIIAKAKLGFPMHPETVKDAVQKILKAANRANPFKDDRPGRKWLSLFLKRHPNIHKCNTEAISKARASVTEANIRQWFEEVIFYTNQEKCPDVLSDPSRIFNADETGVQCCPKNGTVLGPTKFKNLYTVSSGNEKESITVLCTFSANGRSLPPMIVYPYKRIPTCLANTLPDTWVVGRSDSGWMTSSTFYEYVVNTFYEWIVKNNVKLPVIFFLDGHKSHISLQLSEFCAENQILLYCLPANATHILQPCDVSIFKPLKEAWKKEVRLHRQRTNASITKLNFGELFTKAFENSIKSTTVENGFRSCGLYPFSPENVDYTKCMTNRKQEVEEEQLPTLTDENFLIAAKVMEHLIGPQISKQFHDALEMGTENVETEISVFQLWNKCLLHKNQSQSSSTDIEQPTETDTGLNTIDSDLMRDEGSIGLFEAGLTSTDPIETSLSDFNTSDIMNNIPIENYADLLRPISPTDANNILGEELFNINEMPLEIEGVLYENTELNSKSDANTFVSPETPILDFEKENETGTVRGYEMPIESEELHDKSCIDIDNKHPPVAKPDINHLDALQSKENTGIEVEKVKKRSLIPEDVWEKHLHWPKPVEKRGKKVTVKMPYAISSKKWRDIVQKKEQEKEKKTLEKLEKREQRKISKEENEKKRKLKVSSGVKSKLLKMCESSIELHETEINCTESEDETLREKININYEELDKNCFAIVNYEGELFPGIITNINKQVDEYEISVMTMSGPNSWRWPDKPDVLWYKKANVISKIKPPQPVNSRGVCSVPEIDILRNNRRQSVDSAEV